MINIKKKLELAGANHVIMPEQIGGFYMATLVSKPGAVEFFSFLTNEAQSDIGFEEITYDGLDISLIEMIGGCSAGLIRNHYSYDADHRLTNVTQESLLEQFESLNPPQNLAMVILSPQS